MGNLSDFLEPIYRVNKDLIAMIRQEGSAGITTTEARFLVDLYYQIQKFRVQMNNRVKGLDRDATKAGNEPEPHAAIDWVLAQADALENQIKRLISIYVANHEMAWFFDQTVGIGPVLAGGLLAHIDISKAQTAGAIWRFAGLDPTQGWNKGEKRPFNGQLKTLCWKIGDSFCKVQNRDGAIYGQLYRERKAREWNRNLNGDFSDQAAAKLEKHNIGKSTDAYHWYAGKCSATKARAMLESGDTPTIAGCKSDNGIPMLPPAHIDQRAKRYAVKLFLAHLHHRWYEEAHGNPPPAPYIIEHGGHAHFLAPPQNKIQEAEND